MGVRPTLTLFLAILRTTLTHCRSWFMRTGGPSLQPILGCVQPVRGLRLRPLRTCDSSVVALSSLPPPSLGVDAWLVLLEVSTMFARMATKMSLGVPHSVMLDITSKDEDVANVELHEYPHPIVRS